MPSLRTSCVALLFAGVLAFVLPAVAAAQRETDRQRAVELFEQSAGEYRAGRFAEAVRLLDEAYRLSPEPVLLYNLARAHEGLGDYPAAIGAYDRYLAEEPQARDRGAIEQRVATLRRELAERERLERERAELAQRGQGAEREGGEDAETEPEPVVLRGRGGASGAWPWVVMFTGAAVGIAGMILGGVALNERDEADAEPIHMRAADQFDRAEMFATGANIAFVVGGVIAGVGLIWMLIEEAAQ